MRNFVRTLICLLLFTLFLGGCVGRNFPSTSVKDIRPNVTTKEQIFVTFGEPAQKGLDTGLETWRYYHYSAQQAFGGKELLIIFNPNGTVRNYSFHTK